MKNFILLFFVLGFQLSNGQNIVFADYDFKNALLNPDNFTQTLNNLGVYSVIDSNNDNQISVSEAANVVSLRLFSMNIDNLGGLENFTNLKTVALFVPNLLSFDYPSLINLEDLSINEYQYYAFNPTPPVLLINSIEVSSNINLKSFAFSTGNLQTVNLVNNLKLQTLDLFIQNQNFNLGAGNQSVKKVTCGFQTNSDLSFTGLPKLLELNMVDCKMNNLDLSLNAQLAQLSVESTNFTALDLSNNFNLEQVQVSGQNIETLDFGGIKHIRYLYVGGTKLTNIDTSNFFNLRQLTIDNNQFLTNLSTENGIVEEVIYITKCPLVASICCDANEIPYLQNECNKYNYTATVSSCAAIQPSLDKQISMYPNPVINDLHLDSVTKIDRVEVFGSNGLLIMTQESDAEIINMENLQNGMYFLKIYNATEVVEMKFIKG